MTISPKLGGVVASGIVLALLASYFFFWRPSQPPPILTPIQEKTISDLEAANKRLSEEMKSLITQAQANANRATQAQTEAAKARIRLGELEAQMGQIKARQGIIVATHDDALKELKSMGWLR